MRHARLGEFFGFKVELHASWGPLALLLAMSMGTYLRAVAPDWGLGRILAVAAATTALFGASLLLHELAHAAVARSRGLEVSSITLFALAGLSAVRRPEADPRTELLMGLAGTAVSAALAGMGFLVARWTGPPVPPSPAQVVCAWLGVMNAGVAVINLLPGFPLDGGRVLRALIWSVTGDGDKATRWAGRGGVLIAYALVFAGLWRAFTGGHLESVWAVFAGWLLLDAAAVSLARGPTVGY